MTPAEALAELVALKDMRDKWEAIECGRLPWIGSRRIEAMKEEYLKRKDAAWAAAREVLAQQEGAP